ncbi:MAG: DUF1275 domain-containing protein [Lachnospiraceae bacterium]|nr:DUF1275 domain-containing protein [Lachnospiraceae bacterium]
MKVKGQMSESAVVIAILCISGGFQDAYTYNCRDKVFANAQTGNMVLMGQNFAMGNWYLGMRYLLPVLAFAVGIYVAEKIRRIYGKSEKIHWRQIVIVWEAVLLFAVGFMPQQANLLANMLVSFVCAMQVQSFRKLNGNAYATTMCIGNLRAATEMWCSYRSTKDKAVRRKSLLYYGFIGVFIAGAALGGVLTLLLAERAIWISSGLLLAAFLVMFLKE